MIRLSLKEKQFKIVKNPQGFYLKELKPTEDFLVNLRVPDECYIEIWEGTIMISVPDYIYEEKEIIRNFVDKFTPEVK